LFKIKYALAAVQKGLISAWVAGKHVTIDESMVKYMSRAVSFPAKTRKHVLKVFCLCCTYTGVMLPFKVYLGNEDDTDKSAMAVCLFLYSASGILNTQGRILYTANYYISMKLAKHLYKNHDSTLVVTI
jgi:hypothetical protein